MVMTYYIDDSRKPVTLKITQDKQIVIEKSFKSLKQCLVWLVGNSKQNSTHKIVTELVSMKMWIEGSKFKFKKVSKCQK